MPSSDKITIKEVAEKARVSIATVSRYLNNPSSLKEANRKRVENAVKELNYQPLMYARRLAGGRLNSYSLIIPGYEGIFYSFYALELIRNVAASLDRRNIDLHLHIYWNSDNFRTSLADGALFADIIGNDAQMRRLVKDKFPVVVMNRKMDEPDIPCVYVDNLKGAYEATEFLIRHGHKKIANLAGDLHVQCAGERLAGYKSAMEKNNLPVDENQIKITNFSRKEAREKLEEMFASGNMPTAIVCCSDEVASEVLVFAEEKKIRVPADLSVIGFDDDPHCLYGSLMLTTIRQPLAKMAAAGVELLNDIIENKAAPRKLVLDTELIIRDTVNFL